MAAAMIGVGEVFFEGRRLPAEVALADAGLAPLALGPKEGLALLNGTQFPPPHTRWRRCSRRSGCSSRRC